VLEAPCKGQPHAVACCIDFAQFPEAPLLPCTRDTQGLERKKSPAIFSKDSSIAQEDMVIL